MNWNGKSISERKTPRIPLPRVAVDTLLAKAEQSVKNLFWSGFSPRQAGKLEVDAIATVSSRRFFVTQIQITVTDDQLQAALAELVSSAADLTPAMAEIGEYLVRRTRDRFDRSTAPDGGAWPSLAAATIAAKSRRQRTGKPYRTRANPADILKDTFTLRDSITYQPSSSTVAIGTNIAYGIYHQGGSERPGKRPFLGLDDIDRAEILAIVSDHLDQKFQ
jgi:phage virion morphogenesis protein